MLTSKKLRKMVLCGLQDADAHTIRDMAYGIVGELDGYGYISEQAEFEQIWQVVEAAITPPVLHPDGLGADTEIVEAAATALADHGYLAA